MIMRFIVATGVAALLTGTAAAPALGEEAKTAAGPELEEVIVQARRAAESQQAVPVAISTVTDERLETANATSVSDIQRLVPSLQITQGVTGSQGFTIRGSLAGLFGDPGVITYVDDVPIDPRTIVYSLYDLGSVQELKGPQGTLFGKNSTGGAVLFVPKRPNTAAVGGYVQGQYGRFNERRLEAAVNLPVNDTLAFRVAGEIEKRDGLIQSVTVPGLDFANRNNRALRASMLWTPTAAVEDYLQATHYRVRENQSPFLITSVAGPCTGPSTPAPSCLFQPPFSTILGVPNVRAFSDQQRALPGNKTVNNYDFKDNVDYDAVTNSLTWDFGPVTVRNITHYSDTNLAFGKDFDGTPAPLFRTEETTHFTLFYNETQLYGTAFNDRLNWRGGGVYSRQKEKELIFAEQFQFPVSVNSPTSLTTNRDFKSTALFGQVNYDLSDLLRGVSVTAGYRHTWDNRAIVIQRFQGAPTLFCGLQRIPVPATGPIVFPGADLTTCTRPLKQKFDDDNYNFSVDWKPTDKMLLYVATRKGYKAGGFNSTASDPTLTVFQPEVVKDVEAGLKSDWKVGEVPVRLNAALFRAKYTNIQSSIAITDPVTGALSQLILNTAPGGGAPNKATFKGYEVELTVIPTTWLQLTAFYSKVEAAYTQFTRPASTASPAINLSGQNVEGVIPKTYGATAQFDIPLSGPFDALGFTASYYKSAASLRNIASTTIPQGRSSVDMRLAVRNLFDSGADLAVFGKNLEDKVVCTPFNLGLGAPVTSCTEPKTYGVELTYRFGSERR
ncbi:MAG: TonB-dependent receptor plug [Phenylobacterium sp.]|nr:TonB-dependent receptor plug [Phenylobacterium sp.]